MGLTVGVIGLALLATGTMAALAEQRMGCLARLQQVTQEQYQAVAVAQLILMKTQTIQALLGQQAAQRAVAVTLP
jgi:hypothetical protein